jgi:glycosyltransferase involved in cell wall biosynthesis
MALALEYPLMQQGGTEVLVRELIRGVSSSWDIVLVSGDENTKAIPEELSKHITAHVPWRMAEESSALAKSVAARLCELNVQLAHFHFGGTFNWQSNRYWRCPVYHLARSGTPCLTTNHLAAEWLNCGVHPSRPRWQQHLFQLFAIFSRSIVYRHLRLEICVSKHDRARLLRTFPQFRRKILQRYHSLLPADAPPPQLSGRAPVILCVGAIGGRKAQRNLAEAFAGIAARHPQWRLDLVGRIEMNDDAEKIRSCAARCLPADRVTLTGRLTDEETVARMKRASIFAMPSLQEGLGLSLQEALFHGCVGVGTRAGGIPELIDDEVNGLLVPPGDVPALAAALDRLMSNPVLLDTYRSQARPSIVHKGMTARDMVQNYLALYRQFGGRAPLEPKNAPS